MATWCFLRDTTLYASRRSNSNFKQKKFERFKEEAKYYTQTQLKIQTTLLALSYQEATPTVLQCHMKKSFIFYFSNMANLKNIPWKIILPFKVFRPMCLPLSYEMFFGTLVVWWVQTMFKFSILLSNNSPLISHMTITIFLNIFHVFLVSTFSFC